MPHDLDVVQEAMSAAGQSRLVAYARRLDPSAQQCLVDQMARIDMDVLKIQRGLIAAVHSETTADNLDLAPAPSILKGEDQASDAEAESLGSAILEAGKVGIFVVAGGQGSRLGYDGPKGCYPATPVRQLSLFQVFAEKILAMGRRYGHPLPWYVMVSQSNEEATKAYFSEHQYFGLDKADIFFVCQNMLPALDADGEIVLAQPDEVFWSPDGHGGSLLALATDGALDDMRQRGIEQVFYFQVDNPLVQIADPIFLGYHAAAGAGMSTKVVAKRDADEKVGVVGLLGGKHGVIEYSDLSESERRATDELGRLKFNDGNIAVHFLERAFIERVAGENALPFHLARKSLLSVDLDTGERRQETGIKFETFIFDALRESAESVVLSVDRAAEFAPIKNAEGEDSPATSCAAQTEQFALWLEECGVEVMRDENGCSVHPIEISPSFAMNADELLTKDLEGLISVDKPFILE